MREREFSFFCFSFIMQGQLAGLFFLNCGPPRVKKKFTQFNAILSSIFTKFTHQSRYFCYFSVKAKSEYAHHQTKSTQKEKEFI